MKMWVLLLAVVEEEEYPAKEYGHGPAIRGSDDGHVVVVATL